MPAALLLTSGDTLLVGEDPAQASDVLAAPQSAFVTLTGPGGKPVHVRPEHVTAVRELNYGEAYGGA